MPEKWRDVNKYKWRKHLTLTKPEGAILESLLPQYNCANVSQLCKKIVRGELKIVPKENEFK